jgi:hypothetical protein
VTALSGSGPAYVFYFIEAMVRGGEALGLSAEQARALAIATFTGASALAAQSSESPATLRERVTSKGGTTEAALRVDGERWCRRLDRTRAGRRCGARRGTGRPARRRSDVRTPIARQLPNNTKRIHADRSDPARTQRRRQFRHHAAARALLHAVGARELPQSAGTVRHPDHRLGGHAGTQGDSGDVRPRHGDLRRRLAAAGRAGAHRRLPARQLRCGQPDRAGAARGCSKWPGCRYGS